MLSLLYLQIKYLLLVLVLVPNSILNTMTMTKKT